MERNWTWSLAELYAGFDDSAYQRDLEEAQREIARLGSWAAEQFAAPDGAAEKIEAYLTRMQALEPYYKLEVFAFLSVRVNSEDAAAVRHLDEVRRVFAALAIPEAQFKRFVAEAGELDAYCEGSSAIQEHMYYLTEIQKLHRHTCSERDEALLAALQNTGSEAWRRLAEQLTATLMVDVDIEGTQTSMGLASAHALAGDGCAAVRKAAYEATRAAYAHIEKPMAAALNAVKGEVLTVCGLRGYPSPLEMTMAQSRMEAEILSGMFSAIQDSLPAFHRYYKKKAARLGHAGGLPWYDLSAPTGGGAVRFSLDEAAEFIVKCFAGFSPALGEFAQTAFDCRWIDALPRMGKRSGAFCASSIPGRRECRISLHFDGTLRSVLTLAHELGHGYHGQCLRKASYLNTSYPVPLAETASIFCETLAARAALSAASGEAAHVIRETDVAGCAQIVVDIYSRFLFEDALFLQRKSGPLSAGELNTLMADCQEQVYGDSLDHAFLNPGLWIAKPQFYYADRSYHNYTYAFGLLFALGLYAKYQAEGSSFAEKYDAMLAATGVCSVADVGKFVGVDLTQKDFWAGSLGHILREVEALY